MKYWRLVSMNLRRNLRRTILTAVSVAVALFLFTALQSVLAALQGAAQVGSESRLISRSSTGLTFPLPQSHLQRLASTPGVQAVTWANWFGGVYIDQRNFFAQFAIDDRYLDLYPEVVIPEDQRKAFFAERTAALVGTSLMDRFGWTLGQTITLKGTIFPGDWPLTIRGVYTSGSKSFPDNTLYLHYDYVYEKSGRAATPGWFVIKLVDPTTASQVAHTVDQQLENSSAPTKTETERAFQAGFVTMWGNIGLLVRAIGVAVFFAILLVAANTMMMASRERVGELAVLKTLGYPDRLVSTLVLIEALVIAVSGGVVGALAAMLVLSRSGSLVSNIFPGFTVELVTVAAGLGIAVLLGLVSGAVPAWQAARLSVVQALRRVQ